MKAFEHTTGKYLLDYIKTEVDFTPIEFTWQSGDPESMKKICPKLYDTFKGEIR